MDIYFGNVTFNKVLDKTGYKLTEKDKELWDKYYSENADLSEKESCFHIFENPLCIMTKGNDALDAVLKMFSYDKHVANKGSFYICIKD